MTEQIQEIPGKPVQPEMVPEIPAQLPKNSNLPKIVLLVVLGLLAAGGLVYAGTRIGKKQITPSKIIAEPALKPVSPTPDETANWKTYQNSDLLFKYPETWKLKDIYTIEGVSPNITINISPHDSTLMNECMQLISMNVRNGVTMKSFSRVITGEMCSTDDETPREIWIIPSEGTYAPGMSYHYSVEDKTEALRIFDQILSTFKFLD